MLPQFPTGHARAMALAAHGPGQAAWWRSARRTSLVARFATAASGGVWAGLAVLDRLVARPRRSVGYTLLQP